MSDLNKTSNQTSTLDRKQDHLDLSRTHDVSTTASAGWDSVRLPHVAAPDVDLSKVSLATDFLGGHFAAPLLISSMTGGSPEGERINERLARFAQEKNIPMGVGSQRVALENKSMDLFPLRKAAPKATLYANLGLVQLNYGVTGDDCKWLVNNLEAQAFIFHLNPLQEAIQTEGDRNFSSLLKQFEKIRKDISVPVIIKETGCGMDPVSAKRFVEAGANAIDVAGLGGTHWGWIEGLRSHERRELGEWFRDWGTPSSEALVHVRKALGSKIPVIASGGIQNGVHATKALFLGANMTGMALPFLKAASDADPARLEHFYNLTCEAMRIALFCMGQNSVKELNPS